MKYLFVLCSFWSAFSAPVPVKADGVDSIRSEVITQEVVVHGFKQDRSLQTAPVAASVLTGTAMKNRQITGVKEFSGIIPNLFMPDYGSKLTSAVYIRGIGSRINAPSVGLYVDGVPYFEKSAVDFNLDEVDHIEVLRGPQGTLYGRNTMGGIIHIHTRSPFRYKGTTLRTSFGNYNSRDASLSHYGKLHESLAFALSGNYVHRGGYFTNQFTGKKADRMDAGSAKLRLEWKPGKHWTVQLQSLFDYSDQGGYPYAPVDSATLKTGSVNYNSFSSYERTMSTTGITAEYKGDRFLLHSQTAYQYLSDKQKIDQDFSPGDIYFARQNQTQRMVSQEINIKSHPGQYNWLFGLFAFRQGIDNEVILEYRAQHFETQKLYDDLTYGVALYHQSTVNHLFAEGLSLTAGIRYDYEKASGEYDAFRHEAGVPEKGDETENKQDYSQFTPKVSLQYVFPSEQFLYAAVTRGYKTGGFNNSFEREEDRTFKPEYSWNYEVGSKLQAFQGRLKAEFTLFYIDWKNQQIYQVLPSGRGSMLKNAGRSASKGIEVSLLGNPVNGLMLQANYGYTHATFKEYVRSETVSYTGNRLPMVPDQTLSLGGDYTLSSLGRCIDRLTLSVSYNGTGTLYWNENNRVSQSFYGLLNGKVTATKGLLTIGFWAKNITGKEYTAFYFESMGGRFAQKGKPFTLGVDMSIHL